MPVRPADQRWTSLKMPMGWTSNSKVVLHELSQRCQGRRGECSAASGSMHAVCSGEAAKAAVIYPASLCRAILRGFHKQLKEDGMVEDGAVGIEVARHSAVPTNSAAVPTNSALVPTNAVMPVPKQSALVRTNSAVPMARATAAQRLDHSGGALEAAVDREWSNHTANFSYPSTACHRCPC